MAEQDSKNVVIQLPWTVPQQSNIQTIVLQQPAKTHMELNASKDKTAISSFALSVVIALILGGLATWLAYWYGRKSFDLTKQSFDTVIKQIESSERLMSKSNQALIKSQENLKRMEIVTEKNNAILLTGAEFIFLCELLGYEAVNLQNNLGKEYPFDYVSELTKKRDLMENTGTRLELYLGNSHLNAFIIFLKKEIIRMISSSLRGEKFKVDLDHFNNEIKQFKKELSEYFKDEFERVTKGE